jgi:hypothetical protein
MDKSLTVNVHHLAGEIHVSLDQSHATVRIAAQASSTKANVILYSCLADLDLWPERFRSMCFQVVIP